MSATGQITTIQPGLIERLGLALNRWGRRRSVRADISDIYLGEEHEERRAELEEQLLLDREIRAFEQELDRAKNLRTLYRAF
jgi:hypothetical protein